MKIDENWWTCFLDIGVLSGLSVEPWASFQRDKWEKNHVIKYLSNSHLNSLYDNILLKHMIHRTLRTKVRLTFLDATLVAIHVGPFYIWNTFNHFNGTPAQGSYVPFQQNANGLYMNLLFDASINNQMHILKWINSLSVL